MFIYRIIVSTTNNKVHFSKPSNICIFFFNNELYIEGIYAIAFHLKLLSENIYQKVLQMKNKTLFCWCSSKFYILDDHFVGVLWSPWRRWSRKHSYGLFIKSILFRLYFPSLFSHSYCSKCLQMPEFLISRNTQDENVLLLLNKRQILINRENLKILIDILRFDYKHSEERK